MSDNDLGWVSNVIRRAMVDKLYGSISIEIFNGEIRRVVKEESLRPPRAGMPVDKYSAAMQ